MCVELQLWLLAFSSPHFASVVVLYLTFGKDMGARALRARAASDLGIWE